MRSMLKWIRHIYMFVPVAVEACGFLGPQTKDFFI